MDKSEKIKKGKNILRIKLKDKKNIESSFDLMKIPVEWLYQEALCEIGEQESYIEELKANIEELKATIAKLQEEKAIIKEGITKEDSRELRLEVKREELYKIQKQVNKKYLEQKKELRNRVNELIAQIVSYQRIIAELQKKLEEK